MKVNVLIKTILSVPQHSKELSRQLHSRHYANRGGRPIRTKTDLDVLKEKHRFIREERPHGTTESQSLSWEEELA